MAGVKRNPIACGFSLFYFRNSVRYFVVFNRKTIIIHVHEWLFQTFRKRQSSPASVKSRDYTRCKDNLGIQENKHGFALAGDKPQFTVTLRKEAFMTS